ncbi:extracellular solute-binding protein [Paenibacillus silvisoli]|uniref:extracellular solute-binding protein n=1 Tax=Paenibacillus silvisoli TaxID=3110539 RepID=UPI0028050C48|nr:extracellular solute-binding protein [Paenibacillus silvisoli]
MTSKYLNRTAIAFVTCALILSACGNSDSTNNTNANNGAGTNASENANSGAAANNAAASETVDPAAKYDPPIEFTIVGESDPNLKFDEGQTYEKNGVYDMYEKDLGIQIKNKWMVDSKQYDEKVKLSIASDDIPDLMKVNVDELQQLVENDMLADLTDVYDKYATDDTKTFMTSDGGKQLDSAKFDGKLMAIPVTNSPYNDAQFLYVRKDWLQKLNLPEPKSMEDVLKISDAFTNQDPDGNGKADTVGLVAQKEIYNPAYGFAGLFNGFHAYPGAWVEDASGKLAYGSIQPEMKTALKTLQDLFKAGQLDKEFFTVDHMKANELVANNQAGMAFGPFWLTSWPMPSAVVKDNKVTEDWEVFPIPSADANPALNQVGLGVSAYYVVSKKSEHPEAAIKLLNRFIEVDSHPITPETKGYKFGSADQELWKLNPVVVMSQDLNAKTGGLLSKAVEAKDPSSLEGNVSGTAYYNDAIKFLDGDTSLWSSWMNAKPHGSLEIMNQYLTANQFLTNAFTGAPTPAMVAKKSILDQKEQELFTKIVINQAPIDEFDKFVEEWKSLGGEEMTTEVNDWSSKR